MTTFLRTRGLVFPSRPENAVANRALANPSSLNAVQGLQQHARDQLNISVGVDLNLHKCLPSNQGQFYELTPWWRPAGIMAGSSPCHNTRRVIRG